MEQPRVTRRRLLQAAGAGGTALVAPALLAAPARAEVARTVPAAPTDLVEVTPSIEGAIAWYDVAQWGVEGKGWSETVRYYDRLPAKAQATVRGPVWTQSRRSAGMSARFVTDSTVFRARYRLSSASVAMYHMPAIGVSGVDLYVRTDAGADVWLGNTHPSSQSVNQQIVSGVDPGERLYTAYLPLYNGVESLEIGVEAGASFLGVAPRTTRPAVFYGTSIMQGGVSSRPGMSITAILGRRFDIPTINLGFSGEGTMDLSIGELMAEIDAAVYVVDCCPNLTPDQVAERTEPLVRLLREARPETPILLVEDRRYSAAPFVAALRDRNAGNAAALRAAYRSLLTSGVQRLWYLEGDNLGGPEGFVDGSHPSDLGVMSYCDAYEQVLRPILHNG